MSAASPLLLPGEVPRRPASQPRVRALQMGTHRRHRRRHEGRRQRQRPRGN